MGKSKQQKEAESLDLERQRQQVEANEWMAQFSKELAKMTTERFEKEQAYLESDVDPTLRSYAKTGFAPGERKRLRAQSEEDVARVYGQGERTALGNLARMGFRGGAPSGALARAKLAMGKGRAEARVAGLRGIEQRGAETRRGIIPMQMARAGAYNPAGPMAGVFSGRPQNVQQAQFGPGFWGKFGGALTKVGQSAVGAWNPLGKVVN